MAKEMFARTNRKVIPFEQNAEFFHRKGEKYIQNNNYIDAVNYYRKAVEKEPDNIDYSLDLARVFYEMGYYNESNQILFSILHKKEKLSECYYGIGSNFLCLQDLDQAEEFLSKYLELDEYGIYSEEVQEIIDILQNQDDYFDFIDDLDPHGEDIFSSAAKGKHYLDQGEYNKAIIELEKVVNIDPELVFAKNNLALAYFCTNKLDKAMELTKDVLDDYPDDINAKCNMALLLYEKKELRDSNAIIEELMNIPMDNSEDMFRVIITLCETKHHAEANSLLKKLMQYKPYDIQVLHYMAVSCFNLKMYKQAYDYWDKIEKINPNNTISSYYKYYVKDFSNGKKQYHELPYNFQVPYDEVVRRIKHINDLFNLSGEDLIESWEKNDNFYALFNWGLDLNDDSITNAILNVVSAFGDDKAERFLRNFLLRNNVSEDNIKLTLILLKEMNASEPFVAYINGSVAEVNVSINSKENNLGEILKLIPDIAIADISRGYNLDVEDDIRNIWDAVLNYWSLKGIPKMRKPEGWAGALALYYYNTKNIPVSRSHIAERFNISYTTLTNNLRVIEKVMRNSGKD